MIALAPLLLVLVFPASVYEAHVNESYVFSELCHAASFYALNVIVVFFGATVCAALTSKNDQLTTPLMTPAQLAIPLALATALQCISICLSLAANPTAISNILRGAGTTVKLDLQTTGTLAQASTLLSSTILWYLYHTLQNSAIQTPPARRGHKLFYCAIAAFVVNAVIKVARFELIPFSIRLFIVYMHHLTRTSSKPLRSAATSLLLFSILTVCIFAAFSLLRGSDSGDTTLSSILGYFISPFVHLASLLDGRLRLPNSGQGFYVAQFLFYFPGARFYLSAEIEAVAFELQDSFAPQFAAAAEAGLDKRYIWCTAFGYIYADIGEYIYLYNFLLGVLFYLLYKSFIRGSAFGVVLYPTACMSILLWPTMNMICRPDLNTIIISVVFITIYEKVLIRNSVSHTQ